MAEPIRQETKGKKDKEYQGKGMDTQSRREMSGRENRPGSSSMDKSDASKATGTNQGMQGNKGMDKGEKGMDKGNKGMEKGMEKGQSAGQGSTLNKPGAGQHTAGRGATTPSSGSSRFGKREEEEE